MSRHQPIALELLRPRFMRWVEAGEEVYRVDVGTIAEAQGVAFLCPLCFERNGGPVGTHEVVCWSRSRGAPETARPGPGRWALVGTSFADFSLEADPPSRARSVVLTGGCGWHGYVTKGEVTSA